MREKNVCRADHPPNESRNHNWMLCARREQELIGAKTVKVMDLEPEETILKTMITDHEYVEENNASRNNEEDQNILNLL